MIRILDVARAQLAIDLNCTEEDLLQEEQIRFCPAAMRKGCRTRKRQKPFLEAVSMGQGIVVSGDPEALHVVQPILKDKRREQIFESPFFYGQSLYFVPQQTISRIKSAYPELSFFVREADEIQELQSLPNLDAFSNALEFSKSGTSKTCLVMYVVRGSEVIAMAGAAPDSAAMWAIDVDVLPQDRRKGLASYLVNHLAFLVLEKNIVPFFCVAPANLPAIATAYRSGFSLGWVSTYHTTLDGSSVFDEFLMLNGKQTPEEKELIRKKNMEAVKATIERLAGKNGSNAGTL